VNLPTRELCQERLRRIFPPEVMDDPSLNRPSAAAAVFVCLYVGAVGEARRIRPTAVLWMCDEAAARTSQSERHGWYQAASRSRKALENFLIGTWGVQHRPWYGDNTRESIRDETFRGWTRVGAMLEDPAVPSTTSPRPRWSLAPAFAALFDPAVTGPELDAAIEAWQEAHLDTVALTRRAVARQRLERTTGVEVALPGGGSRVLAQGESSLILAGVVEKLAPRLLAEPSVLFISESRKHVDVVDDQLLQHLGIRVRADRLLPDALLFDAAPGHFWFVEAVVTDGPIDEPRKAALLEWAAQQGIRTDDCRFVTAFIGRTHPGFRRVVSSLAWGTLVWFLDEPHHVLRLEDLPEHRAGIEGP
jgi:BsuBI/PstI restriction endonuclease domain/BsuBI/PstI restriction endonuclease HTH domain